MSSTVSKDYETFYCPNALYNIEWSVVSKLGSKPTQEDFVSTYTFGDRFVLFTVCDGHGGPAAATFAIECFQKEVVHHVTTKTASNRKSVHIGKILHNAVISTAAAWDRKCCFGSDALTHINSEADRNSIFKKLNYQEYVREGWTSGTTLCSILVDLVGRTLYSVNLGDSKCVILKNNEVVETVDHSVDTQTEDLLPKLQFPSSFVADSRLCGDLGMTHSIGDNTHLLCGLVKRHPDVKRHVLKSLPALLILGSDGFFNEFKNHNRVFQFIPKLTAAAICAQQKFEDNASVFFIRLYPRTVESVVGT